MILSPEGWRALVTVNHDLMVEIQVLQNKLDGYTETCNHVNWKGEKYIMGHCQICGTELTNE